MKKNKFNGGQTVLIILMVVSVVLVVGLSIASRSVTDVKTSQQTEESSRVFWVAQAGLEKAIKAQNSESGTLNSIDYNVSRTSLGGGNSFIFDESTFGKVGVDDIKTFWLVNHNSDGSLGSTFYNGQIEVCWGEGPDSTPSNSTPALELTFLYNDGGTYKFRRMPFDPYSVRANGNHFSSTTSCGTGASGGVFSTGNVDVPVRSYFVWMKILYMNTGRSIPVRVNGSVALSDQGACYQSSASMNSSNITRKLMECRSWPSPPTIFSYLLFSNNGGIQK